MYSLTLLTRPLMKRAQIVAVVERMGQEMMQRGAMLMGLEHYGPMPLAYDVRRPRIGGVEGGRFSAANWLEVRFVASPAALKDATESLNSDPRVLRWQVLKERDLMPPNGWLSYERTLHRARMAGRNEVADMVRRPTLPSTLPDVSTTAILNRKIKRDRRLAKAQEAMAAARRKIMGAPGEVAPTSSGAPGASSPIAMTAASPGAREGPNSMRNNWWMSKVQHPTKIALESGKPTHSDSLASRGPARPGQRPPWLPRGRTVRREVL